MKTIELEEYAKTKGMSLRRVQQLCASGKISGARKVGRKWVIEESTLTMPSGTTSFEEVRKNFFYVDKTQLISLLLQDGPGTYFFSRPRRFGKSLNMDMLRCFFEIGSRKDLFEGTKVFLDANAMEHFARYPVIHLSLRDLKADSMEGFLSTYRLLLASEIQRHEEVLSSKKVGELYRDILRRIIKGTSDETDLGFGLRVLSQALQGHYGEKVVVLIDEYDTPILHQTSDLEQKSIASFFKRVSSSLLKDNPSIFLGVLTGIVRVGGESIFSDLNILSCYDVFSTRYSDCFGFSIAEVRNILEYFHHENLEAEVRRWYDGYRFGQERVYNPWSICQLVRHGFAFEGYWIQTSDPSSLLEAAPELRNMGYDELEPLLLGQPFFARCGVKYFLGYPSRENVFCLLLSSGYLTYESYETEGDGMMGCRFVLPNEEVRRSFALLCRYLLLNSLKPSVADRIFLSVKEGDYESFANEVRGYLYSSASYFDTAKEDFYHGFTLGLASSLSSLYRVESNKESGLGRYDLCFYPLDARVNPIIIEIKVAKPSSLEEEAKNAIAQIKEKDYLASLRGMGFHCAVLLGISFAGKTSSLAMEKEVF